MRIDLRKMDPNQVMLWLEVGSKMVQLGVVALSKVLQFARENGADDAQIAELRTLYDDLIAQVEARTHPNY